MEKLIINGGRQLNGFAEIGGAKNAALPIMAATILAEGEHYIGNLPKLRDICTMYALLGDLGISAECCSGSKFSSVECVINSKKDFSDDIVCFVKHGGGHTASYDLVKTMRASILVLGPLLARRGKARVSLPGGCAIGERPVDLHISALEKMGASISIDNGYINAECSRLRGAEITFKTITVTGTENILMAATLAKGQTVLNNAAQEPEVVDLANCLIKMGAKISGAGTNCIFIEGVEELNPVSYEVMPDRIEAGTFLCAVAGVGGRSSFANVPVKSMTAFFDSLKATGVRLFIKDDLNVDIESDGILSSVDITTMPYPGFPTDMQAQFMSIMTKASGTSIIDETIFENRFMHVSELKRMGADITMHNGNAIIKGVKRLTGAPVMASDLRASACLVIAGLMAEGTSEVHRIYHLDRGYEGFEKKLSSLGADIYRVSGGG